MYMDTMSYYCDSHHAWFTKIKTFHFTCSFIKLKSPFYTSINTLDLLSLIPTRVTRNDIIIGLHLGNMGKQLICIFLQTVIWRGPYTIFKKRRIHMLYIYIYMSSFKSPCCEDINKRI